VFCTKLLDILPDDGCVRFRARRSSIVFI